MTSKEALKRQLSLHIARAIRCEALTQAQAGELLGIPQSRVSEVMRQRTRSFSAEKLMTFLTLLGHDVQIRITRVSTGPGRLSIVAPPSASHAAGTSGTGHPLACPS